MTDYTIDPGTTIDRLIAERDAALADAELWRSRCGAKCYSVTVLRGLLDRVVTEVGRTITSALRADIDTEMSSTRSPEVDALQQRLTAADERADVLEGRVSMLLRELQELINDDDGILVAAELCTGFVWHALQKHGKAIEAALKTAESQQCQFPQSCPSNCGCNVPLKPAGGGW